MAFTLPPLPYAYDALEPAIDKETMTLHHDKHHKAYTDKLNEAIGEDPSLEGKTIEQILCRCGLGQAEGFDHHALDHHQRLVDEMWSEEARAAENENAHRAQPMRERRAGCPWRGGSVSLSPNPEPEPLVPF